VDTDLCCQLRLGQAQVQAQILQALCV